MHNIWHERNNAPQTEQRLVGQIRGIMKNIWLAAVERKEIERQLAPNEMGEDQEEQIERPNSQDEDRHSNTPQAARSYGEKRKYRIPWQNKRVDAIKVRKNQDTLTEKLQPNKIERKDQGSQLYTEINPHK